MSDQPTMELTEYRVRMSNGELEIARGTTASAYTDFNSQTRLCIKAGDALVAEFFQPLGWFRAPPKRAMLSFEDGVNDALNALSQCGDTISDEYRRGQEVGSELYRWRAVQTDIDNGYLRLETITSSAALSPDGGEKGEANTGIGTGLDEQSTQIKSQSASGSSDSDASLAPSELSLALAGGVEPNPHILPPGFMAWSSDPLHPTNPRPADNDTVICWMGGEDFVGPIPAKDFDWHHASDPILGYQIVTPAPQSPADDKLSIPEGFMPWNCEADMPCDPDREVEVFHADGSRAFYYARDAEWAHEEGEYAYQNILAYRILPSTETSGEVEKNDALLDQEQQVPDESNSQASSTEAAEEVVADKLLPDAGDELRIVVQAEDYNPRADHPWDFSPFSTQPGWLKTAIDRGLIAPHTRNSTDYAEWDVKTGAGVRTASPGDVIGIYIHGGLYVSYSGQGKPSPAAERIGLDSQPTEQDRADLEKPLSVLNADAAVFAEGIVREAQKKEEPRKFGSIFSFGKKAEGVE